MDKVVHFEIPFDNGERATKFYKEVFNWQMQSIPEMNYTMVHTVKIDKNNMPTEPGAINGGMYKRDKNSSKSPVLVIDVSSVDKYAKKIEKAGGKVTRQKTKVGDMGFYAQVADTEGNIIGIWETIKKK